MNYKKIIQNRYGAMFIAIFCSFLWGTAYPVLKVSFAEMNLQASNIVEKIAFAGLRFFLAAVLILGVYRLILKGKLNLPSKYLPNLLLLGFFNTFLQYSLFYNGVANTSGTKGAILAAIGNFFTVILAHYFYRNDRINFNKILGLILGFGGIIVVNWGSDFSWHFKLYGEGFLIITGLASAIGIIMSKNLSRAMHPFLLTGWQMLFGGTMLLLVGAKDINTVIHSFTPLSFALFLYAIFLSATAFALWNSVLKYHKAGEIALYRFIIPVSGAFLSAIVLPDEYFTFQILISLILVSAGMIILELYKQDPLKARG